MNYEKTLTVGYTQDDIPVTITLKIKHTDRDKILTTTAELAPKGTQNVVSFTGTMSGRAGQIDSELRKEVESGEVTVIIADEQLEVILKAWELFHLNDLKAGTLAQEKALQEWEAQPNYNPDINEGVVLQIYNLNPDRGVKYGHGWYLLPISDEQLQPLIDIFENPTIVGEIPKPPVVELLSNLTMGGKLRCQYGNGRAQWDLTLTRGVVSETFEYHCPFVHINHTPPMHEPLWGLILDRTTDLDDVCHDMKWQDVKKLHEAIAEQNKKLERLFTSEELKLLEESTEALECQALFK